MEVVVTTRAIRRAKLWSSRHHQQTNTQVLTGRMPLLSPNQQCQSTLSILMAIFSDGSGLAGTKEWWRWWVVINGAVQTPNCHHQQLNSQLLQAECPSYHPTNSVRALNGKISHSMDLLTPSSPGVFQLCDYWQLLVTLGEGCHASRQPSNASTL